MVPGNLDDAPGVLANDIPPPQPNCQTLRSLCHTSCRLLAASTLGSWGGVPHIPCLLGMVWPGLGPCPSQMNLPLGETFSPIPGHPVSGHPFHTLLGLGGGHPSCSCCTHPGERGGMVTCQKKARQQVTVSSFLEEIRRAKVCCWEGADGRRCHWGHQPGGTKAVSPT